MAYLKNKNYKLLSANNGSLYSKYFKTSNLNNCKFLEVWHLGKNEKQANKLFKLVLSGKKIATSYLYNASEKQKMEECI